MIDDKTIAAIIKIVADMACAIAYEEGAPARLCLRLEELSEDEETCLMLVERIRTDINP